MENLPKPNRSGQVVFQEKRGGRVSKQIESYPICQTINNLNEAIQEIYVRSKWPNLLESLSRKLRKKLLLVNDFTDLSMNCHKSIKSSRSSSRWTRSSILLQFGRGQRVLPCRVRISSTQSTPHTSPPCPPDQPHHSLSFDHRHHLLGTLPCKKLQDRCP